MWKPLCIPVALLALSFPSPGQSRELTLDPSDPVALELVHLRIQRDTCEAILGVEPMNGGLRVRVRFNDDNPSVCDADEVVRITLGGFTPGSYRVEVLQSFSSGRPPVVSGTAQFVVQPGPASTVLNDDVPTEDLSGIWVSETEPWTGMFIVNSMAAPAEGEPLRRAATIFWFDYDPSGAPTWYVLLNNGSQGNVTRYTATGTGSARVVTPTTVGTITSISGWFGPRRVRLTVDGRERDFVIDRFRWTRPAWPSPPLAQ